MRERNEGDGGRWVLIGFGVWELQNSPRFTINDIFEPLQHVRLKHDIKLKFLKCQDLPDASKLTKTHNLIKTPENFMKLQTGPLLCPYALKITSDPHVKPDSLRL